ncbi:hypothetical protein [Mycolicibacterium sp. HS_4_1]
MWRQGVERQDDDIGHDDDIEYRNIHVHSSSNIIGADGVLVGASHRIARTADARDRAGRPDDASAAGDSRPAGDSVAPGHPVTAAHPGAATDSYAVTADGLGR